MLVLVQIAHSGANCELQIANLESQILVQIAHSGANRTFWCKSQILNSGANRTFRCKFISGANLESQIANCMPGRAIPLRSIQKFSSPGFWRKQFCSAISKSSALHYRLDYSGFWRKLNLKNAFPDRILAQISCRKS